MNCYACKHSRPGPMKDSSTGGSALKWGSGHHRECVNPVLGPEHIRLAIGALVAMNSPDIKIPFALKLNPHGVDKGWCTWPLDFDPLWVEECAGFEAYLHGDRND